MKKKIVLGFICLLILPSLTYAQFNNDMIELGASFFYLKAMDYDDSYIGGGINFAGATYFNNYIGLGCFANLLYTSYYEANIFILVS